MIASDQAGRICMPKTGAVVLRAAAMVKCNCLELLAGRRRSLK